MLSSLTASLTDISHALSFTCAPTCFIHDQKASFIIVQVFNEIHQKEVVRLRTGSPSAKNLVS